MFCELAILSYDMICHKIVCECGPWLRRYTLRMRKRYGVTIFDMPYNMEHVPLSDNAF